MAYRGYCCNGARTAEAALNIRWFFVCCCLLRYEFRMVKRSAVVAPWVRTDACRWCIHAFDQCVLTYPCIHAAVACWSPQCSAVANPRHYLVSCVKTVSVTLLLSSGKTAHDMILMSCICGSCREQTSCYVTLPSHPPRRARLLLIIDGSFVGALGLSTQR